MRRHIIFLTIAFLHISALSSTAKTGFDIRAGINLGGTSPLPLPQEIRHINSYSSFIYPAIEAGANFHLKGRWGVRTALRIEMKGMSTSADVKSYKTSIAGDDGSSLSGYYTGVNETEARATMLTIPLTAAFRISNRFQLYAGPYMSLLLSGKFSGNVHDGYLRVGNPTGDKIAYYGDASSQFDFSDNLKTAQFGANVSADYSFMRDKLLVSLALNWGLSNIFESSFQTISFKMYPIYGCLAFGYRF
ncbi:MAG: PorT family protein [Bacteroidaceae bacterium]|nr:PorT family protein [Bacteroidaceae bacterium]